MLSGHFPLPLDEDTRAGLHTAFNIFFRCLCLLRPLRLEADCTGNRRRCAGLLLKLETASRVHVFWSNMVRTDAGI